jgi:hypothetical protein
MALPDSTVTLPSSAYAPFPTYLVAQRASSVQATSLITAASTAYNSAAVTASNAALVEVMNTLIGLGFMKGSV